jgi:hypothetical protein
LELPRDSAAAEFEALDLSPVAPLGACSTVAITDQHRALRFRKDEGRARTDR